ncbi:DUF6457 domain-containing protein [Streptomyces sp. YIM 130001]|uniref:DUF6457 domain-containing protein n=1 Tax=Streptomyces sp. YIM 130001 TaxID=2259644 RepID=UPI001F09539A|nr:DUF6457 domain-containing protein [Streptomyces sp. YIM 130001]
MLAGGASRRLGGVDKPGVRVGGRRLLDRVLTACANADRTVVVAEPRETVRPVEWVREEPPGGGPLAALDAGLCRTTSPVVLVLSADLPFLDTHTVRTLLTTLTAPDTRTPDTRTPHAQAPDAASPRFAAPVAAAPRPGPAATAPRPESADPPYDGALFIDADGRDQPLVAAYRRASLVRGLARLRAEHGALAGLPLRRLLAGLRLARAAAPDGSGAAADCDTWEDIAAARARIREHEHVLDEWMTAVKDELGIELDVDTGVLLDLARDAAHGVARPAAPLTTFLVGYAAGRAGGDPEAVAEAARKATALAERWAEEAAQNEGPDPK